MMHKDTKKYLDLLVNKIHSVVVATVDNKGLPSTRVIDMMLYDEEGLYFLTAKGKALYQQLQEKPFISLSGMTRGDDTMVKMAISFSGAVRNIGTKKINEIFDKNPYMAEIYSSPESRTALEVFCLYKGKGDFFDLSTHPITRGQFVLGEEKLQEFGYFINQECDACGLCLEKCPQQCITTGQPYIIQQEHCLHCGNCAEVCPINAVRHP